ncbi:MAG: CBS domain-containing protein [Candidatus Melainabacteria bacterium]|nr:CBS domain-containing protein [Candidatus Melainabacteria bacterium]
MRVKDIMNTKIPYLREDREITPSDILTLEKVRNIPVVDNNLRLVGLITYRELLKAFSKKGDVIRVRDIMLAEVKTVSPETPLKGVIEIMIINKFGCLPVVDGNKKLMGAVTEVDLLKTLLTISVKDIMNPKFIYFKEDEEISLLDVLNLDKIRNVPVVDSNLRLVGLITYNELLKAFSGKADIVRVRDIMLSSEVITVALNTPLNDAIEIMIVNKFGCLPVVDEDKKLKGVITEIDLLRNLSGIVPMPSDFYALR